MTTSSDASPCEKVRGHVHASPPCTPCSILLPRRYLMALLGVLLAGLAVAAALNGGALLLLWDEPIQRGVEASRTSGLDELFRTFSRLGSTVFVLAVGSLAAAVTWRRCRAVGVALLVATFSRPLLEAAIKLLISRDRPDFDRLVQGTGYSFPSGHVMAAVALWGLMPLVVSLYTRRRWLWWASVVVSGGLILGIAASRVYLGVHWFSDVTGGLIVGTFFLLGVETVLVRQHARYPCGHVSGTSSSAVTGRWSDSLENSSNPSSPGRGTEALVTSVPSDT
jgi:membrane-associated phospholipid phosphatase